MVSITEGEESELGSSMHTHEQDEIRTEYAHDMRAGARPFNSPTHPASELAGILEWVREARSRMGP